MALTYGNGLDAPFNYDDEATIHQDIELEGHRFYDWYPLHYRHLFYLTLAWNHALGGFEPFGYHLFNVTLHFFSSTLLFAVAFFTVERGLGWGKAAALSIAGLTALLFALNPVHSETVTYVSGRASGLGGFFSLLSLLCFIAGSLQATGRWRCGLFYGFSLLAFFCALLSKETSAILPAVLFLYDVFFMRGRDWWPFKNRLCFFYLPILLAVLALPLLSPQFLALMEQWLPRLDLNYARMQTVVVAYAIQLFFWPVNLSFDYDFTPGFFSSGAFFFVCSMALIAGAHAGMKKRPQALTLVIFSLLWFLITIAPTNSLLPRPDLLSERNLYLPSVGVSLLLAAWIHSVFFTGRGPARFRRRALGGVCVAVLCVCLSALLIHRNGLYASNVTLWEDALKKSPGKLRALHNLSHFYLRDKHYDKALATLNRLADSKASPFYRSFAHNNLGSLHTRLGNTAQAETEFKAAIASDPTIPTGYFNLASLYATSGRYAEARAQYVLAEERYTLYRWGYNKPVELALNRAKVDVKLGLLEEAEKLLSGFLGKMPDSADGLLLLGHIFNATERKERAIATYKKVAAPPAKSSVAHNNLGILMIEQGDTHNAVKAFERALSLVPDFSDAHYNLATLLTQSDGDRKKARAHFNTALSLTRDPAKRQAVQTQLQKLSQEDAGSKN